MHILTFNFINGSCRCFSTSALDPPSISVDSYFFGEALSSVEAAAAAADQHEDHNDDPHLVGDRSRVHSLPRVMRPAKGGVPASISSDTVRSAARLLVISLSIMSFCVDRWQRCCAVS